MRLFKLGSSRLKDSEVDEIREQVRNIHDELVRRRKDRPADLYSYFIEQDYWPADRPESNSQQLPPE